MSRSVFEDEAQRRAQLLATARKVAVRAYAPYSGFRVGAAVLAQGEIFVGVNVEISSYGLSLCAERAALAAALAHGCGAISHLALACLDASLNQGPGFCLPCGACRQWLAELAPEALIYVDGLERAFRVPELLPLAFRLAGDR